MTLDNEGIISALKKYDSESKAIKEELLKICWYMRGSINIDQAMLLSEEDRKIINNIVKENLEVVKKTGLPFF